MEAEAALRLSGVVKRYGARTVLGGVSLALPAGRVGGVVGRNGAGKSTLLAVSAGQRPPGEGEVRIDGRDPFEPGSRALSRLGYLPEHPFLYGDLTLGEHLAFVAAVRGLDPPARDAAGDRLLEAFFLEGARHRPARELSRGTVQKAALALALLHDPSVLVLDEPFTGLDDRSEAVLLEEIRARAAGGAAVLVASHRLLRIAGLCDEAVLLTEGGGWRRLRGEAWEEWRADPRLPEAGPDGGGP